MSLWPSLFIPNPPQILLTQDSEVSQKIMKIPAFKKNQWPYNSNKIMQTKEIYSRPQQDSIQNRKKNSWHIEEKVQSM